MNPPARSWPAARAVAAWSCTLGRTAAAAAAASVPRSSSLSSSSRHGDGSRACKVRLHRNVSLTAFLGRSSGTRSGTRSGDEAPHINRVPRRPSAYREVRRGLSTTTAMEMERKMAPAAATNSRTLSTAATNSRTLSTAPTASLDGRSRLSGLWTPTAAGITPQMDEGAAGGPREDSHSMLVRAGFVRQSHSGLYQTLPLGVRVEEKACALLDGAMRGVGASRVALSTLSTVELWRQSGRWPNDAAGGKVDKTDSTGEMGGSDGTRELNGSDGSDSGARASAAPAELFRLHDRRGTALLLSPTHEEEMTRLAASTVRSHRDLPLRLYQITRKYRDELRPRGGLLRTREFLMKDLYTFDVDAAAARAAYDAVGAAYRRFFDLFKLPYLVARADAGAIGGDFSHEFHYACAKGEDDVYSCGNCDTVVNGELLPGSQKSADFNSPATCPGCGQAALTSQKTVELGHTFSLGTKYSEPLGARVAVPAAEGGDNSPKTSSVPMQMGCHGIGVSRLLAAFAELLADARGLQWPAALAPWTVAIVPGPGHGADAAVVHDILALAPPAAGIDVIIDDRSTASGGGGGGGGGGRSTGDGGSGSGGELPLAWKLKDADLVGYPVLVVLGRGWRAARRVEVQCRRLTIRQDVDLPDLTGFVAGLLARL